MRITVDCVDTDEDLDYIIKLSIQHAATAYVRDRENVCARALNTILKDRITFMLDDVIKDHTDEIRRNITKQFKVIVGDCFESTDSLMDNLIRELATSDELEQVTNKILRKKLAKKLLANLSEEEKIK